MQQKISEIGSLEIIIYYMLRDYSFS